MFENIYTRKNANCLMRKPWIRTLPGLPWANRGSTLCVQTDNQWINCPTDPGQTQLVCRARKTIRKGPPYSRSEIAWVHLGYLRSSSHVSCSVLRTMDRELIFQESTWTSPLGFRRDGASVLRKAWILETLESRKLFPRDVCKWDSLLSQHLMTPTT